MSHETYMMALEFGVPAVAAVVLFVALRKKTKTPRRREEEIDEATLEGDLTKYIKSLNRGEVA